MDREPLEALLQRLRWRVIRPLAVHIGGDERSLFLGQGPELHQVREYHPGDDVRRIDWNATARTGGDPAFIREAPAERALNVWLAVDVSRSMHWGTARALKDALAFEFIAVTAELLGRHGNRIGAVPFARDPAGFVPLGTGRAHLWALLTTLRDASLRAPPNPTSLAPVLLRLHGLARRPALVLVVSDFLAPGGWQPVMSVLTRRHDVVAVTVGDPRELHLPDTGIVTLEDPESGEQFMVDTGDARLRKGYARAAEGAAAALARDLSRCGAQQLPLSTGEELLPQLLRFLEARNRAIRPRSTA